MDDVVDDFTDTEIKLRDYISEFGAALSAENRKRFDACMLIASNNQYAKHGGDAATEDAKKVAERMLEQMREIERRFLSEIRS